MRECARGLPNWLQGWRSDSRVLKTIPAWGIWGKCVSMTYAILVEVTNMTAKQLMTEAALATLRGDPDAVQKAEAAIRAMAEQNAGELPTRPTSNPLKAIRDREAA